MDRTIRDVGIGIAVALHALVAEAQLGLPAVPALTGTAGVRYGCDWLAGNDADSNNTGYLDTQATYRTANIPVAPPRGAYIRIDGQFPRARYFGYQTYDGFRPGNVIDTLPDALILPTQGGTLNANPAALPDSNGYTNRYRVEVRFEDVPQPPFRRAPNTIYAGTDSQRGAISKQIGFRIYDPNNPGDKLAGVPLASLTYVGPDGGEIDLNHASPDRASCRFSATVERYNIVFPTATVGQGQSRVAFRPVTGSDTAQFYPNPDSTYLRAQVGRGYGDLIVVRQRAQRTPVLPPEIVADPDMRYWSVCMYSVLNSAVTGCIADTRMTVQADGSYVTVISTPAMRPPLAYPAFGYNWLPFGDQAIGLILLRQILASPAFAGNYQRAVDRPDLPVTETLGSWAPRITYCDSATFAANAASGALAVFDACKAAADRAALLGGLVGTP